MLQKSNYQELVSTPIPCLVNAHDVSLGHIQLCISGLVVKPSVTVGKLATSNYLLIQIVMTLTEPSIYETECWLYSVTLNSKPSEL